MGVKKNYSKKLSKTIALALLTMGMTCGYAYNADAANRDVVDMTTQTKVVSGRASTYYVYGYDKEKNEFIGPKVKGAGNLKIGLMLRADDVKELKSVEIEALLKRLHDEKFELSGKLIPSAISEQGAKIGIVDTEGKMIGQALEVANGANNTITYASKVYSEQLINDGNSKNYVITDNVLDWQNEKGLAMIAPDMDDLKGIRTAVKGTDNNLSLLLDTKAKTMYPTLWIAAESDSAGKNYGIYNDAKGNINIETENIVIRTSGKDSVGIYAGNDGEYASDIRLNAYRTTFYGDGVAVEAGRNGSVEIKTSKEGVISTFPDIQVIDLREFDEKAVFAHDGGCVKLQNVQISGNGDKAVLVAESEGVISVDNLITSENSNTLIASAQDYGKINLGVQVGENGDVALSQQNDIYGKVSADDKGEINLAVQGKMSYNGSTSGNVNMYFHSGMWNLTGDSNINMLTAPTRISSASNIYTGEHNLNIAKYSGLGNAFFTHNEETPEVINGGKITIDSAVPSAHINLVTDNSGIDYNNTKQIEGVLDGLASKLVYKAYVNGERNLNAEASIAEGLTAQAITKKYTHLTFDESTGQALNNSEIKDVISQTYFNGMITGDVERDKPLFGDAVTVNESGKIVYDFYNDVSIEKTDVVHSGAGMGHLYMATINNWGESDDYESEHTANGPSYKIDMHGNDLNVALDYFSEKAPNFQEHANGILNCREGSIIIDNPGAIDIDVNSNLYYAAAIRSSSEAPNENGMHLIINNDNTLEHAVRASAKAAYDANVFLIHAYAQRNTSATLDIKGLVNVSTTGYALFARNSGAVVSVGGGIIDCSGTGDVGVAIKAASSTEEEGKGDKVCHATVNVNVLRDEKGKVIGPDKNYVNIKGDVQATDYFSSKGGGDINLALTTADSSLTGATTMLLDEPEVPHYSSINMWLQNGATWNNQQIKGKTILDSMVTNLYGGDSAANAGVINMTAANAGGLTVYGQYSGNTNVIYSESTEEAGKLSGGNFTITSAAEGSNVKLVLNNSNVDMNDADAINSAFATVAPKLVYSNYVDGEKNLSANVAVANDIVKHNATLGFDEQTGVGIYNAKDSKLSTEVTGEWTASVSDDRDVTVTETGVWNVNGNSKVGNLTGADGSAVNMINADSLNIANLNGSTTMLYGHEGTAVVGGDVNVSKAAEGSEVTLSTDNSGLDMNNKRQVSALLNNMANKLTYAEATSGATNLSGKVQIAEGITSASETLQVHAINFSADNGKGSVGAQIKPEIIPGAQETETMKASKMAMGASAIMWRSESNDLMKRMGDLRLADGEAGMWAKIYGGKNSFGGENSSYKTYQLGYDHKAGQGWVFGGAISYNDGKAHYEYSKAEIDTTSVGVYGTWTDDKGQYADIIAKYGFMKNDMNVSVPFHELKGDYHTQAMSISAEYGKKFENKSGFFVDPSAELTLGHIKGKTYSAKDAIGGKTATIEQEGFDSLIGRLGIRIGQKTDKASVYAKLALAHEFNGDFNTSFQVPGEPNAKASLDFKDTWYEMQVGGTVKLGKNGSLYANYERCFSGKVNEKYRVDAGLRWSF